MTDGQYKETTHESMSQFAARVGVSFKTQALVLENIENHFQQVDCLGSTMRLYFSSEEATRHAYEEFERTDSFLLITSHRGCNEDGERDPHM